MTEDFKTNLRASEDVHKILISTTSKLVGEFANDDILITHAWPEINNPNEMVQRREGPASRCFLLISTKLTELSKSPNIGDVLCSYLAVLYGKRFDNNGLLEGRGMYHVPNLTSMSTLCRHHLPHNSHKPRVDFKIDLNISECDRMSSLLTSSSLDKDFIQTFTACSKFYLRSLQNFEHDPEIAYLNLITAGEILSNFYEYNTVEILDKDTIAHLENIEANMCNGQKISKHFKKLQQGIKRKFTLAFLKLIDDDFFNYSESGNQFMKLKKKILNPALKQHMISEAGMFTEELNLADGFLGHQE